jgi:predicted nuclease with RNAse H fold
VLTAGVDLAAEPRGTALALVEWSTDRARLLRLEVGVTDEPIVELACTVEKIGVDCALGWPHEFVEFLVDHATFDGQPKSFDGGMDWRRRLAYRETDRDVRMQTGRWPLSVSTDRLGLTAMRAAGLMSRMSDAGLDVNRLGSGVVVEVYPGATLRQWSIDTTSYRTDNMARSLLVDEIQNRAPWLEIEPFRDLMTASADAVDAVVAAMSARASALGLCPVPPAQSERLARIEGWIALPPASSLSSLISKP